MQVPDHLSNDLPKTRELHQTLAPKMASCVTPIVETVGGKTYQLGTGTFFRAGDLSFLVTAAHVLQLATQHKATLRLLDGESSAGPVRFRDVCLPKWRAYIGEDPADVAVVPLPDDVVAALAHRCFLRLDEVAIRPMHPGGCWLMGYPAETVAYSESDTTMTFSPFLLAAPLVPPKSSLENFDDEFHFLLNARRDELWWPDGNPAAMPDQLGGISGCPVWQVVWPDGRWEPKHVRIVGVQISYYPKSSLVKATQWGAVAALLHEYCADVRGVLDMHLGLY